MFRLIIKVLRIGISKDRPQQKEAAQHAMIWRSVALRAMPCGYSHVECSSSLGGAVYIAGSQIMAEIRRPLTKVKGRLWQC
jgi:hypothetical protein